MRAVLCNLGSPGALSVACSLESHKMKVSPLVIYAVLSTAARYISSTPLGYVNCFDKQYSAKNYILQATEPMVTGNPSAVIRTALGLRPRTVRITTSGIFAVTMG